MMWLKIFFVISTIFFCVGSMHADASEAFYSSPDTSLIGQLFPWHALTDDTMVSETPYIVNLFASWCTPCAWEHSQIMALSKVDGIVVYGVNYMDTLEKRNQWLIEHGNPYQDIFMDDVGEMRVPLHMTGLPMTFIVDRNGIIRYQHPAPVMPDDLHDLFLPLIKKLQTERLK